MATTSKTEPDPTLMELHAIERDLSSQLMQARHQAEEDWQKALAADATRREALEEEQATLQREVFAQEIARFEQELLVLHGEQASKRAGLGENLARKKAAWVEQLLAMILSTSEEEAG